MPIVSVEAANADFDRFADLMDLDLDTEEMSEDDLSTYEDNRRAIVKAIKSGQCSIDEQGEPTVHLKRPVGDRSTITFHEPTGATFLAVDKMRGSQDVSKMFAMLSEMTGTPIHVFGKLANRDLRVIRSLGLLFLA